MKSLIAAIILSTGLPSTELIYISDNTEIDNLKILSDKYKQDLLINDNRVYLIPQECLLLRHFGGLSENKVNLAISDANKLSLPITQEIFTAKDKLTIDVEIDKQKSMDLVTGKVTKEFLADKDGHLYGGVSEIPIDMSEQIANAQNEYMREIVTKAQLIQQKEKYTHPSCELLRDGSGYKLIDTLNAFVYSDSQLKALTYSTISFP